MKKFIFFLLMQLSSLSFAAEESICLICTDIVKDIDDINTYISDVHEWCLLEYIEVLFKSGNVDVPRVKDFNKHSSERTTQFYERDLIHDFLTRKDRIDLLELLSKNLARSENIESQTSIPCPYGDCEGMLLNEQRVRGYQPVGEKCPVCLQKYRLPDLDKETLRNSRLCTHCGGLVERSGGCNTVHCGHCRKQFKWGDAKSANTVYKKGGSGACVLF